MRLVMETALTSAKSPVSLRRTRETCCQSGGPPLMRREARADAYAHRHALK
jgi:hypothetical protein